MVTRSRQVALLAGVLVSVACLGLSCEKVPLFAPTGSTITLSILPGANGRAQVVAQLIEPAGTPPHSGTHVTFSTTLGTIEPAEALTDVSGRAVGTFQAAANESGFATITAVSGGVKATSCCIAVGSAAVGDVATSANPAIVSSRGGSSTITARVRDGSGNILSGIPVSFTTDNGTVSPTVANTDANGVAQTTLTTSRTAIVKATAGVTVGSDGKPVTPASSTATVTVNATSSITVSAPTPATPTVGQTVSFQVTYGTTGSPIIRVDVAWGDGSASNFNSAPTSVSHAYSRTGSFGVVVTGFDTLGDTASGSNSVTVSPRPTPAVTISADPASATVGAVVTFTIGATSTNGPIISVFVDFGDGSSVTLPGNATKVQHVYTVASPPLGYTVTATATDVTGASGSASTVIIVK